MLRVKNPHYYKDLFNQPRAFIFKPKKRNIMRRLTVHITGARKTSIVTGTKTVEEKGKRKTVDVKKEIFS